MPGYIPETRVGYSENKVQKKWTERGPEGKQLCGRGGQEEPGERSPDSLLEIALGKLRKNHLYRSCEWSLFESLEN